MKTNYVIIIIVVVVLVIIGVIMFVTPSQEQVPSGGAEADEADEAEGFGAQFDGGSESVGQATESIPEVNPLGEAKTNPFENYKNPFGQ